MITKVQKYINSVDTSTPSIVKKFVDGHTPPNTGLHSYFFAITEGSNTKWMAGETSSYISNIYCVMENYHSKELLFLRAVTNLTKKSEFLQLSLQLEQELITEEEYFQELDDNEEKYLIPVDENFKVENFKFISHIMNKLGRNFTSDEIAELFSVPIEVVNVYIDNHFSSLDQ